ncbi:MAG: stage III sporulation AC/AD family protein [Oscillospiraceae bacterium]|nr:stage III sporulation AC/AD family protein [Oscillospiraceae bacterium]
MNDIFTVAGIAVVSAGFIVLLKQYKPEYSFAGALAAGIVILAFIAGIISDIIDKTKEFIDFSGIDNRYFDILFKCLGICIITKIASESCRDFGQASIASKVDLAGKVFIVIVSMPLFSELLNIIKILINI